MGKSFKDSPDYKRKPDYTSKKKTDKNTQLNGVDNGYKTNRGK